MGCCSPNYRKTVNEEEEKINHKGKDSIPLFAKVAIVLIIATASIVTVILS